MNERREWLLRRLAECGIAPAEWTLMHIVQYGAYNNLDCLPKRAAGSSDYTPDKVPRPLAEYQAALQSCLMKGWLQVVNQEFIDATLASLRNDGCLGPIYDMPFCGNIDLAPEGVALLKRLRTLPEPKTQSVCDYQNRFVYHRFVRMKFELYTRSRYTAEKLLRDWSEEDEITVIGEPQPIGQWRLQHWRKFPNDWKYTVERRHRERGNPFNHDQRTMFHIDDWEPKLDRLLEQLPLQGITDLEWCVLTELSSSMADHIVYYESVIAQLRRFFQRSVEAAEVHAATEQCLQKGWVTKEFLSPIVMDDSIVGAGPVLTPIPNADEYSEGNLLLTPGGASVIERISSAVCGPDWDDAWACRALDREDHYYCQSLQGFNRNSHMSIDRDQLPMRSLRVEPIGPWSVYWWERFPAGYRMEIRSGESDTQEDSVRL